MRADEIVFIEEAIEQARALSMLPKAGQIASLCESAGCSTTLTNVHERQYMRGWNPHPPERFKRWWETRGFADTESATGRGWSQSVEDERVYPVNCVTAYNCEAVREVWRDFLDEQREELRQLKGGNNEITF